MAKSRAKWIRSILGTVCLVVAISVVASANFGAFVHRQLYNTDKFTEHATSLLSNAYVRDSIADSITDEIVANVPALGFARGVVQTAVSSAIGTSEFREVFGRAVGELQSQLVDGDDSLTLDLGKAVTPIVRELTGGIPFASALIPQLTGVLEVTVLTRSQAPQLWAAVETTDRAFWISLIGALVLLVLGFVLIPRIWFGLMGVGATVASAAIACLLALWGTQIAIRSEFAPGLQQDTYRAVFGEFAGPYLNQTVVLLVLGIVVLAAGGVGEVTSLRLRNRALEHGAGESSRPNGPSGLNAPTSVGAGVIAAPTSPSAPTRPGPPLLDD